MLLVAVVEIKDFKFEVNGMGQMLCSLEGQAEVVSACVLLRSLSLVAVHV